MNIISEQNEKFKKRKWLKMSNRNPRVEEYNDWNKNFIESFKNRLDQSEEGISDLRQVIWYHSVREAKKWKWAKKADMNYRIPLKETIYKSLKYRN